MKRTDAELVKEALEGDIASFGALVRRYQGAVYGLAYHMVRNFADAEDLAQEAFLISPHHVKYYNLKTGDIVKGMVYIHGKQRGKLCYSMRSILAVNGQDLGGKAKSFD